MTFQNTIEETIRFLIPKFGITPEQTATFRKPSVEICETIIMNGQDTKFVGVYYWEDDRFRFPQASVNDPKSIGHEVGHYLHHELNPIIREQMKKEGAKSRKFWNGLILTEFVAEYAGIVYATELGIPFSSLPSSFHLDSGVPGMMSVFSEVAHEIGYRRAEKVFQDYGYTRLPGIARMNLEEAEEKLPRIAPVSFYERNIMPLVDRFRS